MIIEMEREAWVGCFHTSNSYHKTMLQVACRDLGIDCNYVATGETEEELMQKGMEHGKEVHGYTDADFTPEMVESIKAAVKEV